MFSVGEEAWNVLCAFWISTSWCSLWFLFSSRMGARPSALENSNDSCSKRCVCVFPLGISSRGVWNILQIGNRKLYNKEHRKEGWWWKKKNDIFPRDLGYPIKLLIDHIERFLSMNRFENSNNKCASLPIYQYLTSV